LVHDPRVLFLDEPTSNLDPTGRAEVLELIRDIATNRGIQVLLSSHILDDIEALCETVVILKQGKVVAEGRMADLRSIDYSLYEVRIKGQPAPFRKDLEAGGSRVDETEDGLIKIYMPEGSDRMDVFRAAARSGVQVRYFVKSRTSLEDLFANAVGVE
jgi:ABC-2 type transport system ATP-binding protein